MVFSDNLTYGLYNLCCNAVTTPWRPQTPCLGTRSICPRNHVNCSPAPTHAWPGLPG